MPLSIPPPKTEVVHYRPGGHMERNDKIQIIAAVLLATGITSDGPGAVTLANASLRLVEVTQAGPQIPSN